MSNYKEQAFSPKTYGEVYQLTASKEKLLSLIKVFEKKT
jgi:hypothetical protein